MNENKFSMTKAIITIGLYIIAMVMLFLYGLRESNTLIMVIIPLIVGITLYKFYKGYKEVNKGAGPGHGEDWVAC